MSNFTLAIVSGGGGVLVLILAAIAYFRGNVPSFLAALYCLLLTIGCVVIFYRNTPPVATVAIQAAISRQRLMDLSDHPCATLLPDQGRAIPVRGAACPVDGSPDCTATLDVPADQVRALLAPGKPLSISGLVACQ